MDFPGKDLFKEIWKNFSTRHDVKDLAARGARIAGAAGKSAADKTLKEFPKPLLRQIAEDLYATLASQDVADNISATIRSFDEAKVETIIAKALNPLKSDAVASKAVDFIKNAPPTGNAVDDFEMQIDAMLENLPIPDQGKFVASGAIKAFFLLNRQEFEEIRDLPEEEAKQKFRDIVDSFPSDFIARAVADITDQITPEMVGKKTREFVGKLPSPDGVSNIVHGVGGEASKAFDKVANAADLDEAKKHLGNLARDAGNAVDKALNDDARNKKTFKGGDGKDFAL